MWLTRVTILRLKLLERSLTVELLENAQSAPSSATRLVSSTVLGFNCELYNTEKLKSRSLLASSSPAIKYVTFISASCPAARCWVVSGAVYILEKENSTSSYLYRKATHSLNGLVAVKSSTPFSMETSATSHETRPPSLLSSQISLYQGAVKPSDSVNVTDRMSKKDIFYTSFLLRHSDVPKIGALLESNECLPACKPADWDRSHFAISET